MQGQANTLLSFFCLVPWEIIVALFWNIPEVRALISVPVLAAHLRCTSITYHAHQD